MLRGKLDFAKGNLQRVAELIRMQVLMIDELSMLDCDIFKSLAVRLAFALSCVKGRAA